MREHQLLINGRWCESESGGRFEVVSPATGSVVASVVSADDRDVERAVHAAAAAFERERYRTSFGRADLVEGVATVIDRRADYLAEEIALEHGKPIGEARAEVASAASGFRLAAAEARRLSGQTLPVQDPHKRVMTFRYPIGVFAAVTPWNFPINIPVEYVAPALASGNAVVLKPAPATAGIAALLAECIVEAGVPDGLFSLLTGPSIEMSASLVKHPLVRGVGFTGSTKAGEAIAAGAAGKSVVMELGGSGPVIVLDDVDVSAISDQVGFSAWFNAGQSCSAAERILVASKVHDDLVDALVRRSQDIALGDPLDAATTMGPVNNELIASRLDAQVRDARLRGAQLATGGTRRTGMPTALYYEPTVLAHVPPDSRVANEETFGPAAPLIPLRSDQALLAAANASPFGLSAAVFTRDLDRAFWFAERLEAGQVTINDTSNYWELHLPFGGWASKSSGHGRVGGRYIFDAMTQIKSVSIHLRPSD